MQFFCKLFYFQKIGDLPFLGIGHNFFVAIGVGIGGGGGQVAKIHHKKNYSHIKCHRLPIVFKENKTTFKKKKRIGTHLLRKGVLGQVENGDKQFWK